MIRLQKHSEKGVTDRQAGRQTDRQTDGQTDRQTERGVSRAAWSQLKAQSNQGHAKVFERRFKIDLFSYFNKILLLGVPFAFFLGAKSVLS